MAASSVDRDAGFSWAGATPADCGKASSFAAAVPPNSRSTRCLIGSVRRGRGASRDRPSSASTIPCAAFLGSQHLGRGGAALSGQAKVGLVAIAPAPHKPPRQFQTALGAFSRALYSSKMIPDAKWLDALKLPLKVTIAVAVASAALLALDLKGLLDLGPIGAFARPLPRSRRWLFWLVIGRRAIGSFIDRHAGCGERLTGSRQ